jgi:N6-adenosine-specific RNA methylase IME4
MAKINDKFKRLIPPLQADERKQLEASIIAEGVRDAIVIWLTADEDTGEEVRIIVDGHNRHEICKANGIECPEVVKHFDNEADVMKWMILNQFGRRNISTYQRGVLALELEGLFAEDAKRRQIEAGEIGKMHGHEGGRGNKKDKPLVENSPQGVIEEQKDTVKKTREHLAEIAGVSDNTITRIKTIEAKADDETKAKLQAGEMSVNEAYKAVKAKEIEQRREEIRNTLDKQDLKPGEKKYRIIYADPPWKYGNAMPEYVTEPQDYYLLMDTSDICAMPVKQITEDNAVLFLWSTSPHLPEALEVAKAWGFTYKTTFIWDKVKHNMGHYNSVRHEILLVCTKGSGTPDVKKLFDSVVSIERTEHSRKPEYFREIIETIYTHGNKIELFARSAPEGWDVFGNQAEA